MKKFVKISLISFFCAFLLAIIVCGMFVCVTFAKFSSLKLDKSLIQSPSLSVQIYDADNRKITQETSFSRQNFKIDSIPEYVKEAFIAIEDQNFYSHNGLNYKRMVKAGLNNLRAHSFKEGASTISQQLIKNTHLSSEKTLTRKIKEVILTKKLEKNFSKDEILQSYLNAIYFGNNCYGLEEAANYYFSVPAKSLSVPQAALLAGIIKSPNKYSPILKPERALERRNLVLSEMAKCKYISEEEAFRFKQNGMELKLQTENSSPLNSYAEAALDEATKILNMPAKDIAIGGYKIHTYLDQKKLDNLSSALSAQDFCCADHAGIVVDIKKHAVTAFVGKSAYKILDCPRQPGSCIKPLLVYGPALNEDLISPQTQILDERLSLCDYNPKNADGKYRGYVSATEAVAKSINIPAIKVLSYVGIDKAKAYAESLGIEFDPQDNSFALALGGMREGVTIKDLAQSYSCFGCGGKYCPASFVEYILDCENKIVYHHSPKEEIVFRDDAAFLMTTMLQEAANSGTAKALSSLSFPIAAKTGTVGQGKENKDAWCVAYSPSQVCGVWVGNLDNSPISIAGGNEPTRCVKSYFENYDLQSEGVFTRPQTVVEREIDLVSLENDHILALASPQSAERYKKVCLFSVFNLPKEIADESAISQKTTFNIKNDDGKVTINFVAKRNITYKFFDENKPLQTISNNFGEQEMCFDVTSDTLKIECYSPKGRLCQEEKFKLKKEEAKLPLKKRFV